jgi:hypothetical protein
MASNILNIALKSFKPSFVQRSFSVGMFLIIKLIFLELIFLFKANKLLAAKVTHQAPDFKVKVFIMKEIVLNLFILRELLLLMVHLKKLNYLIIRENI